jgi:hypothetical protein
MRLVDAEVRDGVGGEVADERHELLAVAWIDPVELGVAETTTGRDEVDPVDLAHLGAFLEQLGDPRPQLSAHPGHENTHGYSFLSNTIRRP